MLPEHPIPLGQGTAKRQSLACDSAKVLPTVQLMCNTDGPTPGVHINSLSQLVWSLWLLPSSSGASLAQDIRIPLPRGLQWSISAQREASLRRRGKTPLTLKREKKEVMGAEGTPLQSQALRASRLFYM